MKKLLLAAIMCCMVNVVCAQLGLRGKVVNDSGEPVAGANVWVEYTNIGTSTNENGEFELKKIPDNKSYLRASAMDYNGERKEISSSVDYYVLTLKKSPLKLNEVVVSGTGTHNRLKNSPITIDVISKRELDNANIPTFENAMIALNPSFSFTPNAMGAYMQLNGLSNKYILVLVDGKKLAGDVARNIDLSRINMNNIKRIEILKGAASSLYGSDAIGGVINIITDKRKETIYASSHTRYAEYGQFTQAINVDVNHKWFSSSTSYQRNQSHGWQLNSQEMLTDKQGEIYYQDTKKQASMRYYTDVATQKFGFDPSDVLGFYLQGSLYDKKYIRPIEHYQYNLRYNDYNLAAGAKYLIKNKGIVNLDMYTDNFQAFQDYIKDYKTYKTGDEVKTRRQKYYDVNLRSSLNFGKYNRVTFGTQYQLDYIESTSDVSDGKSRDVYTLSLYAQDEIKLLDKKLQIVPGARFVHHEVFKNRFTPKLAVMYSLENFNFRASYAAGFRAPDMKELFIKGKGTTLSLGNPDLKPETSNYYSLNAEYMNQVFTLSATAYINRIKDIIITRTVELTDEEKAEGFTKKQVYTNSSKARSQGFDINLNSYLGAGLSMGLGYSFVDTKDYETQNPLEKISKHSGTVNANWAKKWWIVNSNINFNGRLQSKRYYSDGDARNFNLWNIATSHRFQSYKGLIFEPGFGVENIFNFVDDRPFGVNYATLSPGRTVYVSLNIKFSK